MCVLSRFSCINTFDSLLLRWPHDFQICIADGFKAENQSFYVVFIPSFYLMKKYLEIT